MWGSRLESLGLNTVEVTVYAKQGDWDSANLWFEDEEPAVVSEMRLARTLGLHVVLVLRVALDHAFERNRFLWHGMVLPTKDADLDEWFVRYGAFVDKWAAIAEREKVDVLAIGSEMSALTNTRAILRIPPLEAYYLDPNKQAEYRRIVLDGPTVLQPRHLAAAGGGDFVDTEAFLIARADKWSAWASTTAFQSSADPVASINTRRARLDAAWRRIIASARRRYAGRLTYAANFDQYQDVAFWDALDLIAINAYFPLRDRIGGMPPAGLRETLVRGWTDVFTQIDRFRHEARVPEHRVLFTELGYTRRRGATAAPWASSVFEVLHLGGTPRLVVWADRPEDDGERAAAMNALAEVTEERFSSMFAGVLYWKLSTIAAHRAIEPFVLVADPTAEDPMLDALIRIAAPVPRLVESAP